MTECFENDISERKSIFSCQIRNAPKGKEKDLSKTFQIHRLGSVGLKKPGIQLQLR